MGKWKVHMYDGPGKPSLTCRQCPCASGGKSLAYAHAGLSAGDCHMNTPFYIQPTNHRITATQYNMDMINPHQTFACPPVSMLTAVKVIDEAVNYHCYFL